ncbi:MAG: DNA alkylation repair protein [Patescibacteria group bacterium]|jgi:3-methyladenine DNA glycosylase AlkD
MTDQKLSQLQRDLRRLASPAKAAILLRFFKTGKGQYGEGDKFLGVVVPEQRKLARQYGQLTLSDLEKLLHSKIHEERLTALIILDDQFRRGDSKIQEKIFKLYLRNTRYINNWDLVDLSAPNIVGAWLYRRDRNILYRLAESKLLWDRRIAMLATFYFICQGDCADTIKIAKVFLTDQHDLIHKAVGWMLREVGKRCDEKELKSFLNQYSAKMPRTMLRYAIERLSTGERKKYLASKEV